MLYNFITDLPPNWATLTHSSLQGLAEVWREQRARLETTQSYITFMDRLRRRIAIETGLIERLYTIDRGITYTLIEHGIDAALIPHGTTDRPASEVVTLIQDQESAIDSVFDYVGDQRPLSTSFIKQLHQLLTRNQPTTEGYDQFGHYGSFPLLRGDWKKFPNNPTRQDGALHTYCPPEHVAAEMDRLIAFHQEHERQKVSPDVEAAWLHHRFTQIHPFQDGNGRVARNLATLIFLKAGWFPLVVLKDTQTENEGRSQYIHALEMADDGDLKPLVDFFAAAQKTRFLEILSLSQDVLAEAEKTPYQTLLDAVVERLQRQQELSLQEKMKKSYRYADTLFDIALERFDRVKNDFQTALRGMTAHVRLTSAPSTHENAGYNRYQIIQIARTHNYYANLNTYKSWLRLLMDTGNIKLELLLSFHELGHDPQGVMICSASGWQRLPNEDGKEELFNHRILSNEPFDFTYKDTPPELEKRFKEWLEDVVILGMDYLRQSL